MTYMFTFNAIAAGLALIIAGLGLPRWVLGFLQKRRVNRFLIEFPNAIDIIVRGIKSGLPLADCIRIIAAEAQEPLKSEFRAIVEAQTMGLSIGDACARLFKRMPIPEANFFVIVIQIQQKAGGNLSEALGNLSKVLRERKKMRDKVKALSMEAKASAWIIGALPIIVAVLVQLSSPGFIAPLFTTQIGHIMLIGSAFWMLVGIVVMKQMINFDI
jgi:tight adherence protein B